MKAVPKRVIIKPDPREEKKGNIYIPEKAKEKPRYGEVIAVGRNKYGIKKGQRVMFNWWKADTIDDEMVSVMENDVVLSDGKPCADRVMVRPDESEKEINGILIPETAIKKKYTGTVESVGSECEYIKKGDRVAYGKHAGIEIEDCLMMREKDILGKLK